MTQSRSLRPDARLVQLHAERTDPGLRLAEALALLEDADWGVLFSGEAALARQLAELLGPGTLRVDGRLNLRRGAFAEAGLAVADLHGDLGGARAAWLFEPDERTLERAGRAGVKIIVDATLSPGGGWPARGADYVVYRDAVTLTGHSDTPLAALFGVGTPPEITAPAPSDLSVALALRDVATLPLRLARAARTVSNLAERLGGTARPAGPTALLLAPDAAPDTLQPLGGVLAATRAVPEGVLLTPGLEDTDQVLGTLREARGSLTPTPSEERRDDEGQGRQSRREDRRVRFDRRAERAPERPRPQRLEQRPDQQRPDQQRADQSRGDQFRASQNRTEQNRTEQNRTEQNRTEQGRPEQPRLDEPRPEQPRPVQPRADQPRPDRPQADFSRSDSARLDAARPNFPSASRTTAPGPTTPGPTTPGPTTTGTASTEPERFTFEAPATLPEETWEPEIVFSDIAQSPAPLTHTVSNGPDAPDQREGLPDVLHQAEDEALEDAEDAGDAAAVVQPTPGTLEAAKLVEAAPVEEATIIAPDLPSPLPTPQGDAAKEDPASNLTDEQAAIYARLREWRNAEAKRQEISRFIIASNATLAEIARRIPYTGADLKAVKGMGPERMKKYGEKILEVVRG